jgi:peptidoglycan/LPS O-acetylase OafA/YrhL
MNEPPPSAVMDPSRNLQVRSESRDPAPFTMNHPKESKGHLHRIPSLDGLRGLSIWSVLLTHAATHFPNSLLHQRFLRIGLANLAYFGVTVFFVISGFLITLLLLKERAQSSTISPARFYLRRAVRILPASLLYITVIIVMGHSTLKQDAYAFTFTTSYFFEQAYLPLQQLWSLSVEEQFYLIWPLFLLRGTLTAKRACWLVMILCPILRLVLKHSGNQNYAHLAPAILDSIAAGCLLAFYHERLRSFAKRYLVSTGRFIALSIATLAVAEALYKWDVVLLWGFAPCLIVLVIAAAIERKDAVLNRGPLVWSGLISYSLYLWQQPFLVFDGPLNYLSVRLPLAFVAAFVSYKFIEQPVLAFASPRSRHTHPRPTAESAFPKS